MNYKFYFRLKFTLVIFIFLNLFSCDGELPTGETSVVQTTEYGSQISDVFASIDDAGLGSDQFAYLNPEKSLIKNAKDSVFNFEFFNKAHAIACGELQFGSCISDRITRTFSGCTYGPFNVSGNVEFRWSPGSNCSIAQNGNSVEYRPNFSISRGRSVLQVRLVGSIGPVLTRTGASNFTYSSNSTGVRRIILDSNNNPLYDVTTTTTGFLSVSGSARGSRTLSSSPGNTLDFANGVTGETCSFNFTNVRWGMANCNCPTQGTITGLCTAAGALTYTLNGCGTANLAFVANGVAQNSSVTFDRCTVN